VVIAIIAILMAAGLPLVTEGIRDSRIRSAGESVIAGLRVAQSEALKRNTTVRFQMMSNLFNSCAISTTGTAWVVSAANATGLCDLSDTEVTPFPVRREGAVASGDVTLEADGTGSFCFNGIGRPVTGSGCNTALSETIELKSSTTSCKADGGSARCLRVLITTTGSIRMCDPAVSSAQDPRIC